MTSPCKMLTVLSLFAGCIPPSETMVVDGDILSDLIAVFSNDSFEPCVYGIGSSSSESS